MKKHLLMLIVFTLLFTASSVHAGDMRDFTLEQPLSQGERAYLGVESDTFTITDIDAEYVFIKAFSMYCPVCQRDAPHINEVYEAVTKADTDNRVRFLGIGLGNNSFEVEVYKKKYDVPFPLVNDKDYVIHKGLGEVGTPTYYIVRLSGDTVETLYSREGETEDIDSLIATIKEKAGIN